MRCTSFRTNTNWSKLPNSFKRISKGDMYIGTVGFMADYLLAKQIGIVKDKYRAYIYATLKEVLPNKYGKIGKIGQQLLHEYDNYLTKYENNFLNDPDYINYKNYLQSPEFQQLKEYIKEIKSTKARLRIAYSFAMSYIEAKYRFKVFNSFLELDERYLGGVKEAWSKLSLWTTYSIGMEVIDYIETLNEKYNVIEQIRYVENTDSLLVEKMRNWYANRTLQDDFANFMRALTDLSAQDIAKFSLGEAGSVILADLLRQGAVRSLHYLGLGAFELAKYTPFGRGLNILGKAAWSIKEILNRSVLAWIGWQIGVEWQLDGWIQFQLENLFKALEVAEDNIGGLTSKELKRLGSIMESLINGEGKIDPEMEAEFRQLLEKASPNLIRAVYNRLKAMEFRQALIRKRWKEREEYIDDLFTRIFGTTYKITIKKINGINDKKEYNRLIKIAKKIWKKEIEGFNFNPAKIRSGLGRDIDLKLKFLTAPVHLTIENPLIAGFYTDGNKKIIVNTTLINEDKGERVLIPEEPLKCSTIKFMEGEYLKALYTIDNPYQSIPIKGLEYREIIRTLPEIITPELITQRKNWQRYEKIPILITKDKKMIYVKKRITSNTTPEYIPFMRINEKTGEAEIIRDENGEINIISDNPVGVISFQVDAYNRDYENDPYYRYKFDFVFRDIRDISNLKIKPSVAKFVVAREKGSVPLNTAGRGTSRALGDYWNVIQETSPSGRTYYNHYWIGDETKNTDFTMYIGSNEYIDYTLPQELAGRTDIIEFLKHEENKLNDEIQITRQPEPSTLAMLIHQISERRKLKIRKYNQYASITYKKDSRKKVIPTPTNKEMIISLSIIMNELIGLWLSKSASYEQVLTNYLNFYTAAGMTSPELLKEYFLKMDRTLKIKQYSREEFDLMANEGIDETVISFIEEHNPLGCYLIKDTKVYTKYLRYNNLISFSRVSGTRVEGEGRVDTEGREETTTEERGSCITKKTIKEAWYDGIAESRARRTYTETECGTKIEEDYTDTPVVEETFLLKVYGANRDTKIKLTRGKRGKIILAE